MNKTGKSPLKWLALWLAVVVASLASFSVASAHPARAQSAQPEIVILDATGPIVPALAGYIERGINEADARNAEAVILLLDTPGGSVTTMLDIVQDIRTADIPVVVLGHDKAFGHRNKLADIGAEFFGKQPLVKIILQAGTHVQKGRENTKNFLEE